PIAEPKPREETVERAPLREIQPPPEAARQEEQPAQNPPRKWSKKRKRLLVIFGVLALIGLIFGVRLIIFYSDHTQTDDAQIEGHISPVIPQVSGYITEVLVNDNERVTAGQVLARIDPREIQARLHTAEAALQTATAAARESKATADAALANCEKGAADLARNKQLFERNTITPQEIQASQTAAEAISANYRAALSQVSAAEAMVAQRQAELDYAKLQLAFTVLKAPVAGIVSRKTVEPGQYVQPGQGLLAITSDTDVWVVANFKETQLKTLRVGQPVALKVDAYPKVQFRGRIDSFASATGAKFSMLPPENASGNFVKVVQRVPVKIVFEPDENTRKYALRIGMNVLPTVSTK
ncbi:MAG TPA: HlyD family secretion protein, partial [Verrucomicrobiae bacterium]